MIIIITNKGNIFKINADYLSEGKNYPINLDYEEVIINVFNV